MNNVGRYFQISGSGKSFGENLLSSFPGGYIIKSVDIQAPFNYYVKIDGSLFYIDKREQLSIEKVNMRSLSFERQSSKANENNPLNNRFLVTIYAEEE